MDRTAWKLFVISAWNNRPYVFAYAALDCLFLASTVAFSAVIALYFGLDVFHLTERLGASGIEVDRLLVIATATTLAAIALVARVLQSMVDARVTSRRELWFARRLRACARERTLELRNAARASNHYGRLSATSMKAASTAIVLLLTLPVLALVMAPAWALLILSGLALLAALLTVANTFVSALMRSSSVGLVRHGRAVALWKTSPAIEETDEIGTYEAAYFQRIFLSSIFGYTALVFAMVFSFALLALHVLGTPVEFQQAFAAFVLAQIYLGMFGRIFGNIVKAAAFLPSVREFAAVLEPRLETTPGQQ